MFSKLSIRNKLIALVSVLLIAPISLGVFAVYEMRAINESAQDIQMTWLPSIRQISELRVQASRYRAILRDHILIADEKKKASINKALDDQRQSVRRRYRQVRAADFSPEERALFNELGTLWLAYRNAANDVIAASAKGDFAKAVEINTDKATPPGARNGRRVAQTSRPERKAGGALSGDKAKSDYALAFRIVLGVLAVMVVIGLCWAVTIVRDIARGISSWSSGRCELSQPAISAWTFRTRAKPLKSARSPMPCRSSRTP